MDRLLRLALRHHRLLAAAFAGLAVLLALEALTAPPPGVPVVVAAHDLDSGRTLTEDDLTIAHLPTSAVPARAADAPEPLVGQVVAGPMRRGEVLTDVRHLDPSSLRGQPSGTVLATVRVGQPDALASVRIGDHVDVFALDPEGATEPRLVASDLEVLALPRALPDEAARPVGLAASRDVALALAEASLRSQLSVLVALR